MGSDDSVEAPGEDDPVDHGDRGGVGLVATLLVLAGVLREGCAPGHLAVLQVECVEPGRFLVLGVQVHDHRSPVGDRRVRVPAVGRHSPMDASKGTALADLGVPEDGLLVGVQGPHRSGFLACDKDLVAIFPGHQHGRHPEVEIGTRRIRTVLSKTGRRARHVERVSVHGLEGPRELARFDVQRNDGVTVVGGGPGVVLARARVHEAPVGIHRGARPHRRPRGCPRRHAGAVPSRLLRVVRDHPVIPEHVARHGVQRRDGSGSRAALVAGISGGDDFKRRDRHEQATVVQRRTARAVRGRVPPDPVLPDHRPVRDVDGVGVGPRIHEPGGGASSRTLSDDDRSPHGCVRLDAPTDTTGGGVQGHDLAEGPADHDGVTHDGRLRTHLPGIGEGECPAEFEVRYFRGVQPRQLRGLIAGSRQVAAEAHRRNGVNVESGPAAPLAERGVGQTLLGIGPAAEVLRHPDPLLRGQLRSLRTHDTVFQRRHDGARGQLAQQGDPGRALVAGGRVTLRTPGPEYLSALLGHRGRRRDHRGQSRHGRGGEDTIVSHVLTLQSDHPNARSPRRSGKYPEPPGASAT